MFFLGHPVCVSSYYVVSYTSSNPFIRNNIALGLNFKLNLSLLVYFQVTMIKHPPCHHLCERLGSVTSRWCVVAITLMTSLLAFTNSHLRAYIQYSDVKSTGYVSADLEFSHVTTVPEYRTISFVKSMKLQSCPLDYFKNLSRGQYTQSLTAPHHQVNMSNHDNYSTQTHLSQAALLSNHSFVKKYLNLVSV